MMKGILFPQPLDALNDQGSSNSSFGVAPRCLSLDYSGIGEPDPARSRSAARPLLRHDGLGSPFKRRALQSTVSDVTAGGPPRCCLWYSSPIEIRPSQAHPIESSIKNKSSWCHKSCALVVLIVRSIL
jgi:hypothetical protein